MKYKSAKGFSGWGQLGILFVFVGVGFIITGIIQLMVGFSLIDSSIPLEQKANAMMKALLKPENSNWLQVSQISATLFLMFLPAFIYSRICNGKNKLWLGFSPYINAWQVMLGFFIIFCANIVAQPVEELSKQIIAHFPYLNKKAIEMSDMYNEQVLAMANLKTWSSLIIALVVIAFFPALFEEVFFRGALQNLFVRWWKKPLLAIIITSLVFSLVHGEIYPFLSRAVLGFALGLMYYWSKNLWVNIIAHFLNNAFVVIQLFIASRGTEKPDVSKLDERFPLWAELISILVFYGLFLLFKKLSAKNRAKIEMDEQKLWIQSTPEYNLADNYPL